MATRISNVCALAACNAIVDLLDAGSGAGYIQVRTGTAPTNLEDAATGTLLGTLTCSDPAFGDAADANPGARATASAITSDSSADNAGDAGWFRAFDSNNVARIQGSCGLSGSGADMILNNVTIQAGGSIAVTSWTFTVPET